MPVDDIFWDVGIGADYHLVPGLSSPRLDQLLSIIFDGNLMRGDAPPPGVAVTFAANFVRGVRGHERRGVQRGDGRGHRHKPVVTTPAAARLPRDRHRRRRRESPPFHAYIRFHIHAGLTRMWLTPSPLTVRRGARNARFSVLAEFSDGTYGDVSNWSPWREPGPQDRTFVHLSGATLSRS